MLPGAKSLHTGSVVLGLRLRLGWLERGSRRGRWLAWVAVVVAGIALLVSLGLLRDMLKGPPVAVSFTRVGGTTRVETALEASRFWRQPPRLIVEVGPGATKAQMLDAARCAMVKDAPLLFMSRDAKRNRLEATTIGAWQAVAPGSAKRQRIRGCVPHGQSDIGGVSTLAVPRRLLRLHRIGISGTLNPVVVFAAIWAPKDPADVAVGMALAAHLERANRETVSLVVVPRYLEDDPGLEHQLRSQRETVKDGIVLGSTSVLPEDTRTLLRQLLRPAEPAGRARPDTKQSRSCRRLDSRPAGAGHVRSGSASTHPAHPRIYWHPAVNDPANH